MAETLSATDFFPQRLSLPALREAAQSCRGCDIYKRATQTVFGEGSTQAQVMLVGEIPGDREDREGKPFVGPAGRLLNEALEEAGFERRALYLTNAVKHFSWEPAGPRRLHKKPRWREIKSCRPSLEAEIAVVKPELVVCLGATAAQSLLGADFRITRSRGQFLSSEWAPKIMATYHPSAILRAPQKMDSERMRSEFVSDLKSAAQRLGLRQPSARP